MSVLGKRKRHGQHAAKNGYAHVVEVIGRSRDAESFAEFEYSSLRPSEEIRLLRLFPSKDKRSTILCELYTVPSFRSTGYTALSYTWGGVSMKISIVVNERQFSIQRNLWWALHHLRRASHTRILWIDAVCINQNDISERNDQVKKMGDIYSNAESVFIWLGCNETSPEVNRALFESMAMKAVRYFDKYPQEDDGKDRRLKHMKYRVTLDEWKLFNQLGGQEYWNRVWVIQEIILAKNLRLFQGSGSFEWQKYVEICKWYRRSELHKGRKLTDFDQRSYTFAVRLHHQRSQSKLRSCRLVDLIYHYGLSHCGDVRDKIYGILSLAEDGRYISADYSKTVLEVYWDMVWFQNIGGKKFRDEDFIVELSSIHLHGRETVRFSQFLQRILGGPFLKRRPEDDVNSRLFSALRLSAHRPVIPRVIAVLGRKLSKIIQRGPIYSQDGLNVKKIKDGEELSAILDILNAGNATASVLSRLRNAKKKLVEIDLTKLISIRSSSSYALSLPLPGGTFEVVPELDGMGTQLDLGSYQERYDPSENTTFGKSMHASRPENSGRIRVFVDTHGCIGLAPESIREDDLLCKFATCDVVAVMRRISDRYVFVGRAAVFSLRTEDEQRLKETARTQEMLVFTDVETLLRLTQ